MNAAAPSAPIAPPAEAKGGPSSGEILGSLFFLAGAAGGLYFFRFFDVSLPGREVVNLELMSDREHGMIASGVAVFAFAMRWDMSDPERKTHRADIAFWLHLVAAPLIAHPLFHAMGVFDNGNLAPGTALGVIALYLAFGLVALAVDRRALLVSALVYVMAALYALIHGANADAGGVAFAALIVGGGLLTLSALWATARRALLRTVPPAWTHRLPPAR